VWDAEVVGEVVEGGEVEWVGGVVEWGSVLVVVVMGWSEDDIVGRV
jgi:hypothetical protein